MDNESIKKYCIEMWGNDENEERLKNFSDSFDKWIKQIPDDCQSIVKTLIKNISYYPRNEVNKWLVELHNRMMASDKTITEENTIFTFIKSRDGKTNSSNDYWTEYKLINCLNKNICYEDINRITDIQWNYIKNIVFVDDFCGTGSSLIDELKKHEVAFANKNVFFIVVNAMQDSIDNLFNYAETVNFNVFVFYGFAGKKAFDRELFEDNKQAKDKIVKMSKGLNIGDKWILGFENTQALVVFFNNTPNNTLGFIWHDTDTYESIFPRKFDYVPSWQKLNKSKKQRKNANYNNMLRNNSYG